MKSASQQDGFHGAPHRLSYGPVEVNGRVVKIVGQQRCRTSVIEMLACIPVNEDPSSIVIELVDLDLGPCESRPFTRRYVSRHSCLGQALDDIGRELAANVHVVIRGGRKGHATMMSKRHAIAATHGCTGMIPL